MSESDQIKRRLERADEIQRKLDRLKKLGDLVALKCLPYVTGEKQIIGEEQRKINEILGIGDEIFLKYYPKAERGEDIGSAVEEIQAKLNRLCGSADHSIDEAQREINRMCGVDDETFRKWKPKL